MLREIFRQIKTQTMVGWSVGWLAAIGFNALLQQKWDWKFWAALTGVLLIRMGTDLIYAWNDARQSRDDSAQ